MAQRTTIDNPKRLFSYSKRTQKGTLVVEQRECPFCHHDKAFITPSFIKCTRCKEKVKK